MKKTLLPLVLAALVGALGCASPVPLAQNHPISTQYKIRASHHWDVIAEDVVHQTILAFEARSDLAGKTLYIQPPQEKTDFHAGFQNFLTARLVSSGLPVVASPLGALEIRYETQVVRHRSYRPAYLPGGLTTLAGGTMVARNLIYGTPSPWIAGGVILGTAAALDFGAGHAATPTHTELIVTTSITDNGAFVMCKSDAYYFEEADISLFIPPPPPIPPMPSKEMEVVGE